MGAGEMSFRPDHELHKRRLGRNLGLGGALLAFVLLVFGMTIEKVTTGTPAAVFVGEPMENQPSTGSGTSP